MINSAATDTGVTRGPLRVVFSKPMTMRSDAPLPDGFEQICDESRTTFEWSKKIGYPYCDWLTQAKVVGGLLAGRSRADVLISGRFGDFFAILQGLVPFGKKPFILLEPEWMSRHAPGLKRTISVLLKRLIARGASRIQVICEAEVDNYVEQYGIAREKFVWIPYCTDDAELNVDTTERDYIFSGGRNERDWATFHAAVKDLDIEVRIAAPPGSIPGAFISENMTLLGRIPRDQYFQALAGAKLVVLSLEPDIMRFPGVITYVYALRLGKCVIVNERTGAQSYIRDGDTGVIVDSQDPGELRAAIERMLADAQGRVAMGVRARLDAMQRFSIERYLSDLDRLAREVRA